MNKQTPSIWYDYHGEKSNYVVCPDYCRNCLNFEILKDGGSFNQKYFCKDNHHESAASFARINNRLVEMDNCKSFKDKSSSSQSNSKNVAPFEDPSIKQTKNQPSISNESLSKKNETVIESCFYCGQPGNLVLFHDECFHIKCKSDFLEKEEGKTWLAKKEKESELLKKRKKQQEELKIEAEKKLLFEQEQRNKEENEKKEIERKENEKKAVELKKENKIIFLIRPIVFIIVSLIAITYKNSISMILNGKISFIIAWMIILLIFYKTLGAIIGSSYETVKKAKLKYESIPKFYYIMISSISLIFITLFWGIVFIIMHFLLKLL